jgi:hypothetical protein
MRLDRLLADGEPGGDPLVREARGHELEHLALALGQGVGGPALGPCAEHGAGRLRVQRRLPVGRGADAREELLRVRVLEQVADGPRVQRAEDAVAVGV